MARSTRNAAVTLLAGMIALTGCATRRPEPPAIVAAPVPPRPAPPAGIYGEIAVPPLAADGAYLTINHGIDANAIIWHVRAALNVAALGCRGPGSEGLTSGYNALLRQQRTTFAASDAAIRARFRSEGARDWQTRHDVYMTRLYNYFAQPGGQTGFCAAAAAIITQAATVAPDAFGGFAAGALPRLDAPFTTAYSAYGAYRRDLAAWESRYGTGAPAETRVATITHPSAPIPMAAPIPAQIAVADPVRPVQATQAQAQAKVQIPAPAASAPKLSYAPVGPMLDWRATGSTRSAERAAWTRLATAG